MAPTQTFGARIRDLRRKNDLSLRELGRLINLSAPFISDIELNKRFPSEETLLALASVLGVSADHLRSFDSRPPVDELRRGGVNDPELGFALREIVEEGVTGRELKTFLEQRRKRTDKK